MVLYPNKLPESERVCSGICNFLLIFEFGFVGKLHFSYFIVYIHNVNFKKVCYHIYNPV